MVEEVNVMFRIKSFQNLLRIAEHPILSKHVRDLYYSTIPPVHITKNTLLSALNAAREAGGVHGRRAASFEFCTADFRCKRSSMGSICAIGLRAEAHV